ncbi:leucine-rich repeat-containing protein 73 isoform X3 [Cebidichthys violaceus]|uniref:leucine-rich repeat-containing protein 73 isoform X3 n=1 Tax=Cebidichthys violaceus TaxID=271503 RepID=UPI0035C95454
MLPASIQITGELLSAAEVQDICESLKEDGVRLLSIRGCQLSDRDFGRVCRGVAESNSLAQLNLNLGVVSGINRTRHLADALKTNRSLQTLFLHGSPLLDAGLVTLNSALSTHPTLVCLDLGDCMLGDEALGLICGMLPPDGAKSGLRELTLSANPGISSKGWARLAIAVAHSSQIRVLNLDYNPLGDQTAGMLAVAVASSRTLEVLDLEGTGLTNQSAQVIIISMCSWTWWRTTPPVCASWSWQRTTSVRSCSSRSVTCCLRGRRTTTGRPRPHHKAPPQAAPCCQSETSTSQSETSTSQSETSTSPPPGSPTATPAPRWSC